MMRPFQLQRRGTAEVISTLFGDLQCSADRLDRFVELVENEKQFGAVLLENTLRHQIAAHAREAQRPIERVSCLVETTLLRVQHAKVVQHPYHGLQVARRLEATQAHPIVRKRRGWIAANIRSNPEVLLNHS